MQVEVYRGDGDKQGEDIVDSLLTDKAVGIERGKGEINSYVSKIIVNGNCPLQPSHDTGALVQVSTKREVYRGKLTFFSQTGTISPGSKNFHPTTSVKIERVKK